MKSAAILVDLGKTPIELSNDGVTDDQFADDSMFTAKKLKAKSGGWGGCENFLVVALPTI